MTDQPTETGLLEAIELMRRDGFGADFSVDGDAMVRCGSCGDVHQPEGLVVREVARTEGISDPDDSAVVFGLECRGCGTLGVLVAAYGASVSTQEAAVVTKLEARDRDR